MKRNSIVYVGLALLLSAGCGGNKSKEQPKGEEKKGESRTFEMVSIPMMVTEPAERAEFVAKHFWDKFDFTDTMYIHLDEVTGQAFANYLGMLQMNDRQEVITASITDMLKRAAVEPKMFHYFTEMYEKYLYDPNSPFRNEEWYIPVLETMLASPLLDETAKIRPADRLKMAMKNRVGEQALDFSYTLYNGNTGRLYDVKADFVILFFNNPDCPACKEIIEMLNASPLIREMLAKGSLKILAVYPDEDIEAWKRYQESMPKNWINGYDGQLAMREEELYDLRAIPCLYLLDREKRVLIKDGEYRQVADYLVKFVK
ncbi:DUF5106 domain-containing protein [Parabacteroides sp. OttesenSCG-928-N08]|nr:DUF5106 domain-containing protein [Parabacteroides sp. OttesenSCG-928-N08]